MQQWARFAILGAMFVTAYLLILAWQKDYGHSTTSNQPAPAAVVESHEVSADLPNSQATATSTLYLFRSIGSVWGVAISAGVIQLSFAGLLRSNLKGLLDENKIKKLIVQLSANSSYIGSLHGEVKNTVILVPYSLDIFKTSSTDIAPSITFILYSFNLLPFIL